MTPAHTPHDAENVLASRERFNGELAWHLAHMFLAAQHEQGHLTEAEVRLVSTRLRQRFKPVYDVAEPAA